MQFSAKKGLTHWNGQIEGLCRWNPCLGIGSAPASNGSSATGDPRRQGLSAFDPKKESLRSSTSLGGLAALIKGGGEGQDEEVKLASLPDVDCRGHLQGLCDLIGENRIDEKELKGPETQAIELDRDEEEKDTVSLLESPHCQQRWACHHSENL